MSDLHQAIDDIRAQVPFGTIQLSLTNHEGNTVSAHATFAKSDGKFQTNDEAKEALVKVIDEIRWERKNGGCITVTLFPRDGVVERIVTQDTKRTTWHFDK